MNKDLLIVVPYRNREEHLKEFLENSPKYFNSTNLSYDILICELDQQGDWNAGLCVNSLVDFINKDNRNYEWLYIHHVDVWPTQGEWTFPSNKEVYFNLGDYGSCLMKMDAFFEVDGYSNSFWGWGGEDNELYEKLKQNGYNVVNYETKNVVKYNTKFQGHERKFNGKNYANAIKQSMLIPRNKRSNIRHFHNCAETKSLECLRDNIYRHIVYPKCKSPNETVNKKLILTYVKNISEFDNVVSYTKSAQLHAAYEFDMVAIFTDNVQNTWLVNQLETFGIKCVFYTSVVKNLNLDKYYAYKKYLEEDNNYEFVLHVDIKDTIFQTNPFESLNLNATTLFKENDQIVSRPIAATKDKFLQICSEIINKSSNYSLAESDIDIKILNNYFAENSSLVVYKTDKDAFCVNLKTSSNLKILNDRHVLNSIGEKYAIVQQYNSNKNFQMNVDKHFKTYYFPL